MRAEVWAPNPTVVELQVGDAQVPMWPDPDRDGWWISDTVLPEGTRYGFLLDGEGPFPDPRTRSQPDGVHALSAVPHTEPRRAVSRGSGIKGGVLYEVHVGTFTPEGTLDAAIGKLDHLVELGIDAVELMPLNAFAGERGWGYDGVALWSVHAAYGGEEALRRFIDAAHTRGLGVVLDVVHNHFGPEGNYLSKFGPYFTENHTTPWGAAVNLDDEGAAEVRNFLIGSARHFLVEMGADALRLDAVHALQDDSERHFLVELSDAVADWEQETARTLTLFAESDLNQAAMVSPAGSSPSAMGMDGQWADDIHHALHSFFGRETQGYYVDFGSPEDVVKAFTSVFVRDGGHSAFLDQVWGAPVDRTSGHYDGHSFVASLQNHDQVGNRAVGDRFHMHAGHAAQRAAAALYLLGPFTPMMFMGEEWAASAPFPFFSDLGPDLGPFVTEGRAREFAAMGWDAATPDPQAESTFISAKLNWDERDTGQHGQMLSWYRTLLELRRQHPEIRDPNLAAVEVEILDPDTVAMKRGRFTVVASRETKWQPPADAHIVASAPGSVVMAGKMEP